MYKRQNPNIALGKRKDVSGKLFYKFSKEIVKKGAKIIGGCCETTPEHIREISKLK